MAVGVLAFPAGLTQVVQAVGRGTVNSVVPGITDPINNRYRYKLGKGRLRRIGPSEFKDKLSFVPRNLT